MDMFCVAGSPGMSRSIWRHCLNRKSCKASHNSSAGLRVSLNKSRAMNSQFSLRSLPPLMDKLCVSRNPDHHTEENSALPVVSWSLDMRILQLPWKRLLLAGPREHDGAPAYEDIAGTSTYMFTVQHITCAPSIHTNSTLRSNYLMNFSPCRCCLLERPLIPAISPPSTELSSLGGERQIDSSLTTPPSVRLSCPGQSFKRTTLLWQKEIHQIHGQNL